MKRSVLSVVVSMAVVGAAVLAVAETSAIQPVPFTRVHIDDVFWAPRLDTNRQVTVPYCFEKCRQTGRISNFAKAGGLQEGQFEGIYFNDSDLYKVIEGAAYSLQNRPDPELEAYVDDVIDQIAAAQWPDGYLYTYYSIPRQPEKRWTDLGAMHELYCAGHFFEAAAAYYQVTGKRKILDVAVRLADHIDSVFGPGRRHDVPGHEEIEIGLVKLYRVTGQDRYLDLAKFFLDERGNTAHRERLYGLYCQDHLPVTQQSRAVGHAVRAGYLYCGMADVAALVGDAAYVAAIDRLWDDVLTGKTYLTGGIGARHGGEAFGESYELPNKSAYNETCAAIANAMWNHRLFLLHGHARYIDVLERIIYNGFLSGVALEGNRFFYPNPLASDGGYERSPWFGCACCPVNIVRFVPSIPGYVFAAGDGTAYVNLYIGGAGTVRLARGSVRLEQKTRYPWDGHVAIRVEPHGDREFAIALRIPGWARDEAMPGDLYRFLTPSDRKPVVRLNGENQPIELEDGYVVLRRSWVDGDVIELELPMPIRRVLAHPSVQADLGRVALQRGPMVYCFEEADNGSQFDHLLLGDDAPFKAEHRADLLGGVTVLVGTVAACATQEDGLLRKEARTITAIPYYAWAHRGAGAMRVWLPRTEGAVRPLPAPTIASRSKVSTSFLSDVGNNRLTGVNDQIVPRSSNDKEVVHLHWWPHKGTTEWVQYDFAEPATVRRVKVYWFDDTGEGECRVPASWRLLYREGDAWRPVQVQGSYGVAKDTLNEVVFEPVRTDGLRMEVTCREGFSTGVKEWIVE